MMKIVNNQILKKYIILADQGVISGVNFVNALLIAKMMGVHAFGVYAMSLLAVQFLGSIQQAFIIKPLFSLYPEESERNPNFLTSINSVQIVFSFLSMGVFFITVWIMSFFFNEFDSYAVLLSLTFYGVLVTSYDYLRRVLILKGNLGTLLISDLFAYGSFICATILVNSYGVLSVISLLTSYSGILVCVSIFVVAKLSINWWCLNGLSLIIKKLWGYSKFLVYTSVLQWFSGNLFILFAGIILGPISLGVVRIAQSIMGVFNVLFLALENIIPLKAAYVKEKDENELIPYFKRVTLYFGVPVVLVVLILSFYDEVLIGAIFGKNLGEYGFVIGAFAILYLFVYLNTMQQFFIRTIKANQIVFKSYLAAALFGVLFSKMIIEYWGLHGVLIGLFVSQIMVNAINYSLIKKVLK